MCWEVKGTTGSQSIGVEHYEKKKTGNANISQLQSQLFISSSELNHAKYKRRCFTLSDCRRGRMHCSCIPCFRIATYFRGSPTRFDSGRIICLNLCLSHLCIELGTGGPIIEQHMDMTSALYFLHWNFSFLPRPHKHPARFSSVLEFIGRKKNKQTKVTPSNSMMNDTVSTMFSIYAEGRWSIYLTYSPALLL